MDIYSLQDEKGLFCRIRKRHKYLVCLLLLFGQIHSSGQQAWKQGRLTVSDSGHYLQTSDHQPFFWLGDTGWELFHRLDFSEIKTYLVNRHQRGFNVIQAVVLPELDGLRVPNRYGQVPLIDTNPETPNPRYFELIDSVVHLCAELDIFLCLLPTWGDKVTPNWGAGPAVFNEKNAYLYAKWLGNRYKNDKNVIWMLGGDRPPKNERSDWIPIWRAMAKGLQESIKEKIFITYHTWGNEQTTSYTLHNEDWLSMNTMQSGHNSGHDMAVWQWIAHDYNLPHPKPTLDAEPNYEDHPVNPWPKWDPQNGYFNDYDVRKQCYRSVFSGGAGVTYGHHAVWQFYSDRVAPLNHVDRSWQEAILRPGAVEVGYLRRLIESRPYGNRIPDNSIIVEGQGEKGEFITAFKGAKNDYAMIYIPFGKKIGLDTKWLKCATLHAWWYDPRSGKTVKENSVARKDVMTFVPPALGFGQDWVLIIDNSALGYGKPGRQ